MKNRIEKLRSQLQSDPSDLTIRSELLHELILSDETYSEEAKKNVIWFIKNRPDYGGNWAEWKVCFLDSTEFNTAVDLWRDVLTRNRSIETLRNAAYFSSGRDQTFSIECFRDVLSLTPDDKFIKEDLALGLFYRDTKSDEAFRHFDSLYEEHTLDSIFVLSVAILCAFEVNKMEHVYKWSKELFKRVIGYENKIMIQVLYPVYSALILDSALTNRTENVLHYLKKLEDLNSFSYSNFVIFDERTIKILKSSGYTSDAKKFGSLIFSQTNDDEIKNTLDTLFEE